LKIKIAALRTTIVINHAKGEDFAPNSSKNMVIEEALTKG
jgi:hypothetical protein